MNRHIQYLNMQSVEQIKSHCRSTSATKGSKML